jgi:poly(3-hydroxybutyrate) depolymerase
MPNCRLISAPAFKRPNAHRQNHFLSDAAGALGSSRNRSDILPPVEVGLTGLQVGSHRLPVLEEAVVEKPFARLIKFNADLSSEKPTILIVAPLSGLRTALLYDMVGALMPDHQVHLLAWRDAANVAVSAGPFGIDGNIEYVIDSIRGLQARVHLIGFCQSALPSLAATALLEDLDPGLCPLTLTLIGAKLDTRINPRWLDRSTRSRSIGWFRQNAVTSVMPPKLGEGRSIYASYTQAASILASLAGHFSTGGELARKAIVDDGSDPESHPFLRLVLAVMNVPGELFLDMISLAFHEFALPRGFLHWRGTRVDPSVIRHTALLTIEGTNDDISGRGQTRVAHALCTGVPPSRHEHYDQHGVGHFGLFHGRAWREEIMPRIRTFVRMKQSPSPHSVGNAGQA